MFLLKSNEEKEKENSRICLFLSYSSAIKNLEQTQGTWRQTPTAARHEAQLERLKTELKVKRISKRRKKKNAAMSMST